MKSTVIIYFTIFLVFTNLTSQSQELNAPRLIVRGDDMGSSHASNLACMESFNNGIETSIEVLVVAPWFPEAAKLLRENPGVDVGVHLTLTSEWDNIKWRPLTNCPSLTDPNGYFFTMTKPNPNYPGLAIHENKWKLEEIEQEFRAQIEMALKNVPRVSHISGHMGSTRFDKEVGKMTQRLATEYNLADISTAPESDYKIFRAGYEGPNTTLEEKESSFIRMLEKLEPGKTYAFIDHPAFDSPEMKAVHHIGYENVSSDRQGVTELYTSEKMKLAIQKKGIQLSSYNAVTKSLLRGIPKDVNVSPDAISNYLKAVEKSGQDLHSLMVLRHGKVIGEKWFGENAPDKNHIMNSVSKTFTSIAAGFAVQENLINLNDKVISFFPEDLPENKSAYLEELKIRDLLTLTVGHESDPTKEIRSQNCSWERLFLATPIDYKPGTRFVYSSIASYMISAIIQKVTGEKILDYLYPRLLLPLGITGAKWLTSPTGVNTGGWGLYIRTEDMAKLGQFLLQKGKWKGKQLLSESWIEEASSAKIKQAPIWVSADTNPDESDWMQGYCYHMWRCRHNAFRADGANGQFIIILPEKDAVIVTTADIKDMQAEIDLIWEYLLPGFN